EWILEYPQRSAREVDPLMGWTSSDDTQSQVKLRFETKEAALSYAKDEGIEAVVLEPKVRKINIRPRGYGENFATDRKVVWTH
ncbi:MAG: ETC complex I subunit, partial [Rhodobacteraceae bacterium]|nr:ETC complex I subunit [Paracoccaceae bacterium]